MSSELPRTVREISAALEACPDLLRDTEKKLGVQREATLHAEAPRWPEPLAEEAYYGLSGEVLRTIEPHTEADPAAILFQFLTAFGSVIGIGPHFTVEGSAHRTNLFVLLVGETAKARKGVSLSRIRQIFVGVDQEWERTRILGGLSSGEGLIYNVRDPIWANPRTRKRGGESLERELVDEGVADKRLLVVESEFSSTLRVLERDGNTLSPVLRCAWDGLPLRTMVKHAPASAQTSLISLVGHITQEELIRYLTATEQANGFANRFLFGCVRRSKCLPDGGTLSTNDLRPLIEKTRAAVVFARGVGEMHRDKEAGKVWAAAYQKLSEGVFGLFGALTARAEAHVLRLSLLYALLDSSAVIRAPHIFAALAAWEYSEASVGFIFSDALGDPVADEILRALRDAPEGLSRTAIRDHFGRHKRAEDIERGLALLERLGKAECQTVQTEGRSVERWVARTHGATEATKATKGGQ